MTVAKRWGSSRAARRLLGAAAPEFKAAKKVRWVRGPNGIPKLGCAACGWAKGVGHDRWCRYVGDEAMFFS